MGLHAVLKPAVSCCRPGSLICCQNKQKYLPLERSLLLSAKCGPLLQVWRPEERANTTSKGLYQKHKETPFANTSLPGKVELTILRGQVIFNSTASTPVAPQICGKTLLYRDLEKPNRGLDFYH